MDQLTTNKFLRRFHLKKILFLKHSVGACNDERSKIEGFREFFHRYFDFFKFAQNHI